MRGARFIGTFSATPNMAGFELPIFRTAKSDMTLIQNIGDDGMVRSLDHRDFGKIDFVLNKEVSISEGACAVFAFRHPDTSLRVGTRAALTAELAKVIEEGVLDTLPLMRFRLSSFCGMSTRVSSDAESAWTWIKDRSSAWSADIWKLESTIVPEFKRCIAIRLRSEGEEEEVIANVWRRIDGRLDRTGRLSLVVCLPGEELWARRCKRALEDASDLLGEVVDWWPDLRMTAPAIVLADSKDENGKAAHPGDAAAGPQILYDAKKFLFDNVFAPVLNDPSTPKRLINIVRNTRILVSKFTKIGDLVAYIERFSEKRSGQLNLDLATKNASFEKVYDDFIEKYGRYRGYFTSKEDFVVGAKYSWHTLSVFSRTYDNRGGGIRLIGKAGVHEAVLVNATLSGKKYENAWIEEGRRLKYYLKGRLTNGKTIYSESFRENKAIIHFPLIPIMVFARESAGELFTYHGIFRNERIFREEDGSKWFELVKIDDSEVS